MQNNSTLRPRFEHEVMPHLGDLFGLALHLCRNRADAEDLVQDTTLRAYRAWERFEPGGSCKAWLSRIMTNAYISRYRRARTRRRFLEEHHAPAEVCYGARRLGEATDPETSILAGKLSDEVLGALETLREDQQQVVLLVDVEGLAYKDVARVLDIPVGTVMSRLFRARRQLEASLASYAEDEYGIRKAA